MVEEVRLGGRDLLLEVHLRGVGGVQRWVHQSILTYIVFKKIV